ncbi:hypothetical protein BLNAU_13686 [Blattamonas nauphoetae]|uniref:Uncharacterized protein n=1 Tax=Blattamonas nauphoetae TaxID=2049346 RepID=A0ABQ9XHB2_9EUKA|nr:hypothetical protein BLNAU_13686 [Blattamonas nauphoetae]
MTVNVIRGNDVMHSELTEEHDLSLIINSPARNRSNLSSLLEGLQCDDDDIIVDTLRELQKVASESVSGDSFDDWCSFLSPLCCGTHSPGLLTELMHLLDILYSKSQSFVHKSISSEIPSFVVTQFGDWSNCHALESCCSCMESLFYEPTIVDSFFLQHMDFFKSTFRSLKESSPSHIVLTTLARLSLFPHLRMAYNSLLALRGIVKRNPPVFTHLPSPIFPSSSPHQLYSGLSFMDALTKKLRTLFSDFERNLPTDPSHLPNYIKLTKDDPYIITRSISFCSFSYDLPIFLFHANPSIEVDSEIIQDLILFAKETLTKILTHISNIDDLIASLPSDPSPTDSLVSTVDSPTVDSLTQLRNECEEFVSESWCFFIGLTCATTVPTKSSFQTIILDDPSFPDLIFNSLKRRHSEIRENTLLILKTVIIVFPWMRDKFIEANLVGRMFETVDFVSLPLSESNTLCALTDFIAHLFDPIGDDEETWFEQYRLIRAPLFEPAKQFITFMFINSNKLVLEGDDNNQSLEDHLCSIHNHINNMELQSDEHDSNFVSELVKWEVRTMVEMENEEHFEDIFENMCIRTCDWNEEKRERQKRREVLIREEGWDDSFELRVVGIEVDTNQDITDLAEEFRIELAFNADET